MDIVYAQEPKLSVEEFQHILHASTLAERRPVDEPERLQTMLRNSNIIVAARDGGRLVGVSRAITDFGFCCYLSDLAVDGEYQGKGIGKELIAKTHQAAGLHTTLYLVSAPAAEKYYPKIGMQPIPSGWLFPRSR